MNRSEAQNILNFLLSPDPNNWELGFYLLIAVFKDTEKTEAELNSVFSMILCLVLFNSQYTRNYGENRYFHRNLYNILKLKDGYYYKQYEKLDRLIPIIRHRYRNSPEQQYLRIMRLLRFDRLDSYWLTLVLNHRLILLNQRTKYTEQWILTYLLMHNGLSSKAQFCLKYNNHSPLNFCCFLPNELLNNSTQFNHLIQENESIDLSNNSLTTIPDIVYKNQNIKYLSISRNFIKNIDDACANWSKLELLSFYRCKKLRHFSPQLIHLSKLNQLRVISCKLEQIPDVVLSLKQLTFLNLSRNKLHSIPPEIGQLKDLKILYLEDNIHLEFIHKNIEQLTNLEELNLTVCNISELPSEICNLTQLKILTLQRNPLKKLPSNLHNLKNLAELNLRFTDITCDASFWENILAIKQLSFLQLTDVKIIEKDYLKYKDALSKKFSSTYVDNFFYGVLV